LVTGGAGFIGAHLVQALLKLDRQVLVLDDLSGGFRENLPAEVPLIVGSVTDHVLVERMFQEHDIRYVYHLAAYAAEGLSHFIKRFNYTNNLIGSVNLINESVRNKVECFVFTSSIAVYGALPPPMSEDLVPAPEDPYGIAKLAVEQELRVTHEMFGLDYVIFRPHNVYGEFQNIGDRYRNVVGIFMNALMQGGPLTIFGDGTQTRSFSYVRDVAPIIARSTDVPEARNHVFNIGADEQYSVRELAEHVMSAMGQRGQIRSVASRNEVMHAHADHRKLRRVFGDHKTTSLTEGLGRMAAWAKSVGVRKAKPFSDIEILDRLPAVWLED
jgi:UDP-glucose 4-epimerase